MNEFFDLSTAINRSDRYKENYERIKGSPEWAAALARVDLLLKQSLEPYLFEERALGGHQPQKDLWLKEGF